MIYEISRAMLEMFYLAHTHTHVFVSLYIYMRENRYHTHAKKTCLKTSKDFCNRKLCRKMVLGKK